MQHRLPTSFDKSKHVFHSPDFEELIKDAVRFFNGTPVHRMPPPERFTGTGVYALYYIGRHPYYAPLYEANRMAFALPIYVGKAVPKGWRQGRVETSTDNTELYKRLNEHAANIAGISNLQPEDFACRVMILEGPDAALISTIEAELIKYYRPVWNSCVDGFGNHDPGAGRYNQARSDWDVLHPGRAWAEKCTGSPNSVQTIEAMMKEFWAEATR